MKKLIPIIFLIIFSITFVYAQEISLNYPNEVSVNEEFTVELELINFSSGIYDVKIDIVENDNRISQILNNGQWKSTYYYLLEVIEPGNSEDFTLKIIEDFNEGEITIKIRDSSGSANTFTGYEISKSSSSNPDPPTNETNQTTPTNFTNNSGQDDDEEPAQEEGEENSEQLISFFQETSPNNPKQITQIKLTNNNSEIKDTKPLKNKNYSPYYLLIFCFLLAFLYLLKEQSKKKTKKNEFR